MGKWNRHGWATAAAGREQAHTRWHEELPRGARRHELVFDRVQRCHALVLFDDSGGLQYLCAGGARRLRALARSFLTPAKVSPRPGCGEWEDRLGNSTVGTSRS